MALRLRSFPPVIDAMSRVLILGSMPSDKSLAAREYYAHPQNQFWALLAEVLGEGAPESYQMKLAMLQRGRVALWDTMAVCVRPGSGDAAIRDAEPNDIAGLLEDFPGLRAVFVNGRAAESMLARHFPRLSVPALYLPSSSPALASLEFADKLKAWRGLSKYLA